MRPEDAAAALQWLAEMGADEIIGEEPVDRFAAAIAPPAPAMKPAAPVQVARPPIAASDDAASLAAACTSLDDIVATLQRFDACPLKKTATNLCFSDGNPAAHVMIVGEAPGRDEDIQGKPFVGRSGQLLDRMLAAIGLSRHAEEPEKSVFITNTIFWRPPGNRDPTESETMMCLPFVLRAIELQRPRVVLGVGKISSQRLLSTADGILKLRGKWREISAGSLTVPFLPTLHPAYLLRRPIEKRLAWRDLLSLRQALDAH
ncbi:uracil-DNA glycosylase [Aestuariivirga sp.]|uniref:uracil-DNA glycosylase n=1 Tax=Aestuariivirga sp. TaxID=2650926 RepID=UPI0039E391D9